MNWCRYVVTFSKNLTLLLRFFGDFFFGFSLNFSENFCSVIFKWGHLASGGHCTITQWETETPGSVFKIWFVISTNLLINLIYKHLNFPNVKLASCYTKEKCYMYLNISLMRNLTNPRMLNSSYCGYTFFSGKQTMVTIPWRLSKNN